jgi:hypothetical protein
MVAPNQIASLLASRTRQMPAFQAGVSLLLAAGMVAAGCEQGESSLELLDDVHEEDTSPEPAEPEDSDDGEGTVRPSDADVIADDDHVVAVLEVESDLPEKFYVYKFMATEDGISGVVTQGDVAIPQPIEGGDICPLHTFLKVAPADEIVPPLLLGSCASKIAEFARDDIELLAGDVRVRDLRNERTGSVEYDVLYRSHYCSGGDGGKGAFESERCSDIQARVLNTDGPCMGCGDCAIHTSAGANGSCFQEPNAKQRKAICDSHVTGGWLQRTSSLTIFPDGCFTKFTTKTRWQVAACVQPLVIKWKQRLNSSDSWPSGWNHFTTVNPNYWASMALYAGTGNGGHGCVGSNCWQVRDFRVAIDQQSGDGRFRAANGWAAMQGISTSSQCTLAL